MLSLVAANLNQDPMKTFHLISRKLYQIHHCLPCTYGQTITPLQYPFDKTPMVYRPLPVLCNRFLFCLFVIQIFHMLYLAHCDRWPADEPLGC
jgi:hypothetical protein